MEFVCPTYVGMNRNAVNAAITFFCMPHVCGDEPHELSHHPSRFFVCPTYVGMNRRMTWTSKKISSMPHVCGDEPDSINRVPVRPAYAPRMWG